MSRNFIVAALLSAFLCLRTFPSQAGEPGITARQADEIIGELKKIRELLEKKGPPTGLPAASPSDEHVKLNLTARDFLGKKDAPLTMVEFVDYQCPFCRQYHLSTFDQITKDFVETGQVRYMSLDFPLDIHDRAKSAANAARCAGEQGRFWGYRHILITNSAKLTRDDLLNYARDMHLDIAQFAACVDSNKYLDIIRKDIAEGSAIGVSGTPTFVIGKINKNGVLEGIKVVGAQPFSVYEKKLRDSLQESR